MEIDLERKEKHEKEILEMILQFCYENKYHDTAKLLESKTDIIYDQNEIQELKYLLKEHEFEKSIKFLEKSNFQNLQKNEVLKVIKSRRLIEMIKNAQFENALEFIRKELSPLFQNFNILNKFSSMLFIKDKDKLERYLRQNFNDIVIDDSLIVKVQNLLCLSLDSNGNRILPNSRLENLLNKYYNIIESENFIKDHYNGNSDSIYLNKNPSGNQDKYSDKKNINLNEGKTKLLIKTGNGIEKIFLIFLIYLIFCKILTLKWILR